MREIALQCPAVAVFGKDVTIDENGFCADHQRFIDQNIDVYLASGGSGEGQAVTWDELKRVYQIGVAARSRSMPTRQNITRHGG